MEANQESFGGLPLWKCHKIVGAFKIDDIKIDEAEGYACLFPESLDIPEPKVTSTWMKSHNPKIGGYFVVYEDGYTSYSPASAFEKGLGS